MPISFGRNVLGETFWPVLFLEPHFESGAGCWAGLATGRAGLGWWAGWVGNPVSEIGLFANETEIGLFENGKVCLHRINELPDGQQQQAISIYFFHEGLGSWGYRV